MQLGRLDVPIAEQVLCARDLAAPDQPEDHPLVQASSLCGGCEGVGHLLRRRQFHDACNIALQWLKIV
jgi:hypothetical protein